MFKRSAVLKYVLFFLFPIISFSCREDTVDPEVLGSISGVVVDAETNEILENVSITTNPATSALTTDNSGGFIINNIPVGSYSVTAKKSGYRTESVSIMVVRDKVSDVRILLTEGSATNRPPNKPTLVSPANQAEDQPVAVQLIWDATDPDGGDSLFYDVELFESGNLNRRMIATDISDTTVVADALKYNTVYTWQVTVRDENNEEIKSDVWSFRTIEMPDFKYLFVNMAGGSKEIFTADSDSTIVRLTNTSFHEHQPLLSPLRDKIAFTSNEFTNWHIFTMNRDGTNRRRVSISFSITGYHNDGIGYAWSPDGSQIIYAHNDRLYKINRNGTGLHQIATAPAGRHFRHLDWTDMGSKIVAQTIGSNIYDSELYLMNADGSNMTLFLSNMPGRIENPTFSISGQEIMFTRDADGLNATNGRQFNSRIFLMKVDKSDTVDISHAKPLGFNDTNPRFSPNGAKVIFEHSDNSIGSPKSIWVMDIDGNNRTELFPDGEMPDWK